MIDYNGWYDKVKILLKEIIKCQYVACMNPTAGSFNITPRMQRQFMTLAVQMPPPEIVRSIYFQVCVLCVCEPVRCWLGIVTVTPPVMPCRAVTYPQHAMQLLTGIPVFSHTPCVDPRRDILSSILPLHPPSLPRS